MDNIIIIVKNFYYTSPYLALAIGAALLLSVLFNTKAALKAIGVLLILALLVYSFSFLGDSASTGMDNKKQMINQTVDRNE